MKYDNKLENCPLCASKSIKPYYEDFRKNKISRCVDCQIQFMNPQYSDVHLAEYYSHYGIERPEFAEATRSRQDFYLSLIEKYVPRGRFFDLGCGDGSFLSTAKERGWDPVGYDVDEKTTKDVSKSVGVPVLFGNFFNLGLENQCFDAISMNHVLEHVKNPTQYIESVRHILKPQGVLFIAIPNIQSFSAVSKFYLEKIGLRKNRIGAYFDSEHHLLYFTPRTLKTFLERNGFKVVHMRSAHQSMPNQSQFRRWWMRNISDRFLWKSSLCVVATKNT